MNLVFIFYCFLCYRFCSYFAASVRISGCFPCNGGSRLILWGSNLLFVWSLIDGTFTKHRWHFLKNFVNFFSDLHTHKIQGACSLESKSSQQLSTNAAAASVNYLYINIFD